MMNQKIFIYISMSVYVQKLSVQKIVHFHLNVFILEDLLKI